MSERTLLDLLMQYRRQCAAGLECDGLAVRHRSVIDALWRESTEEERARLAAASNAECVDGLRVVKRGEFWWLERSDSNASI